MRSAQFCKALSDGRLNSLRKQSEKLTLFGGQKILCDEDSIFVVLDGLLDASDGSPFKTGNVIGNVSEGSHSSSSLVCRSEEALVTKCLRHIVLDLLSRPVTREEEERDRETEAVTEVRER